MISISIERERDGHPSISAVNVLLLVDCLFIRHCLESSSWDDVGNAGLYFRTAVTVLAESTV